MPLHETPYQNSGLRFLKTKNERGMRPPPPWLHVMGLPFDGSVSFRPGSRLGPDAIRQASQFLTDGAHPVFRVDPAPHIFDWGDLLVGTDISASLDVIETAYSTPGEPMFSLGGDHLVTLGILRGLREGHPDYSPAMRLIIFDAHCDTWDSNFGLPHGHGTWVRNAIEEGIVKAENVLQIGVRSPVQPEVGGWLREQGGHVVSVRTASRSPESFIQSFSRTVAPLYVSIDIDVLDPAYAPGTGTPECGGLTSSELFHILEEHISYDNLIGADLVEVCPPYDHSQITALAGATAIWTMMSGYLSLHL